MRKAMRRSGVQWTGLAVASEMVGVSKASNGEAGALMEDMRVLTELEGTGSVCGQALRESRMKLSRSDSDWTSAKNE